MRSLLAFCLVVTSSLLWAQDPDLGSHFAYDKNAPLDIQEVNASPRGDVIVHDISYASPKGGRVPAYLVTPKAKGRYPAILWGHWYWENSPYRNRKEFLDEAIALGGVGVVSLLTDGPIARPGHVEDKSPLTEQQITDLVQQVIDMRRGADLLQARPDVDPTRLAFVGHSYNAGVGAFLAGIDRRFKAFALMAGDLSDDVDMKTGEFKKYRDKIGPEKFDAFAAKYAWANPAKYISHAAPAVVLLQYATQERFLKPDLARQYAEIVSEPKRFELYDAPHALNGDARHDRIFFLAEELKFRLPSIDAIASIPDLFQPSEPDQP